MMTREELVRGMIEARKNGEDDPVNYYCNNFPLCKNCPYEQTATCSNQMLVDLIDEIIKLEQKPKGEDTNLAWYFCGYEEKDGMLVIWLENESLKYTKDTEREDILSWLLSEYQKRYKISKFEYDFLECLKGQKADQRIYYILNSMREKGYFKDIPTSVSINDILDNCEVIDEQPTIEERKKGKWILHENQPQEEVDNGNYLYVCSECGKSDIHAKTQEVPFCWWCGSEMREEYYD